MMEVYLIEYFVDYEGSQIGRVYSDEEDALLYCEEEVKRIKKDYYPDKEIEKLPTGYRIGSRGVIYQKRMVE